MIIGTLRARHDESDWFHLNEQQKLVVLDRASYALHWSERTHKIVRTLIFGTRSSHGDLPLNQDSNL